MFHIRSNTSVTGSRRGAHGMRRIWSARFSASTQNTRSYSSIHFLSDFTASDSLRVCRSVFVTKEAACGFVECQRDRRKQEGSGNLAHHLSPQEDPGQNGQARADRGRRQAASCAVRHAQATGSPTTPHVSSSRRRRLALDISCGGG